MIFHYMRNYEPLRMPDKFHFIDSHKCRGRQPVTQDVQEEDKVLFTAVIVMILKQIFYKTSTQAKFSLFIPALFYSVHLAERCMMERAILRVETCSYQSWSIPAGCDPKCILNKSEYRALKQLDTESTKCDESVFNSVHCMVSNVMW